MPYRTHVVTTFVLLGLFLAGCRADVQPETRAFEMTGADIAMVWGITIFQEEPCSGNAMAGGELGGHATFAGIGTLDVAMTSAWNVDALLDDDEKEYEPVSEAAPEDGPAAPVLGIGDYPHAFQFDPFENTCLAPGESVASATGEAVFTAGDGDELYALVTGGETHRLDFIFEGDGIETFAEVEFAGGTGRFEGATGSFVIHTIFRFDLLADDFALDLVEVLPGGTITY